MAKSAAIGIMCKAPRPGRTKTRLAASIGAETAASLSACFLRDLTATVEGIPSAFGRQGYAVYAPAGTEPELRQLLPDGFQLLLQADSGFGNVLYGAARELLERGHDCVLLVNGDSPTLPARLLIEAVELLRSPGDRVVLGPASDGGYYLIGLKQPHPHLFEEIPWSTERVAALTLARAAEIGLAAVTLAEWYDVDDAETLEWLRQEFAGRSRRFPDGAPAEATRMFLASLSEAAQ